MSEVYDIRTGKQYSRCKSSLSEKELKLQAKQNDKFRRRFDCRVDIDVSPQFKTLKSDALADIFWKLKFSRFKKISFGSLPEYMISSRDKEETFFKRSAGILHVGEPTHHIVWQIDSVRKKMKLCMADEYFN